MSAGGRAADGYDNEEHPTIRVGEMVAARCAQCPAYGVDEMDFENFRLKMHLFLDHPESSKGANLFSYYIINMILLSAFKLIFSTVREWQHYPIWTVIEYWIGLTFFFEYLLRWAASPRKCFFFVQPRNIIDGLAVIPFFLMFLPGADHLRALRIIRVWRIFRVLKLGRHLKYIDILKATFKHAADALSLLFCLVFVGVILFSVLLFNIEYGEYDAATGLYMQDTGGVSHFINVPTSIYWCITTLTTVGYGDVIPQLGWGKFFAVIAMLSGVLLIAFVVTVISSSFASVYKQEIARKQRVLAMVQAEKNKVKSNEAKVKPVNDLHEKLTGALEDCLADLRARKVDSRREKYWTTAISTIANQVNALAFDLDASAQKSSPTGSPVNIELSADSKTAN